MSGEDAASGNNPDQEDEDNSGPPLPGRGDRGFSVLWAFFSSGGHEVLEIL